MNKIDELKAAFEAATPGEWELTDTDADGHGDVTSHGGLSLIGSLAGWYEQDPPTNGEFIALAHNLMPQLLEAVEVLKQIKVLLDDHPQAAIGNTKVHVVVCKATGALNAF